VILVRVRVARLLFVHHACACASFVLSMQSCIQLVIQ
jgi:hypothetical protein